MALDLSNLSTSLDPASSASNSYSNSYSFAWIPNYHHPETLRLIHCMKDILSRMTYKPGWKFDLDTARTIACLMIVMNVPDVQTGRITPVGISRPIPVPPPDWDQSYVLLLIKSWIHELEEHEMKEWLRLDGECVDDPHPELVKMPKPEAVLGKMETMGVDRALDSYNQMITTQLLNTMQAGMNRLIINPLEGV